jgi:acyl dehydratase
VAADGPTDWDRLLALVQARSGVETTPTVTEIEKSMISSFAVAIGASSPLHYDETFARSTYYGGIIAPPAFVSTFVTGHIPDIFFLTDELPRSLHTDDQVEIHQPIRPGDRIKAFARHVGAQRKEGRQGPMLFQSADLILAKDTGQRVAELRIVSVSF